MTFFEALCGYQCPFLSKITSHSFQRNQKRFTIAIIRETLEKKKIISK